MKYLIDDYWDVHLSGVPDIPDPVPPLPVLSRKKSKISSESYKWPKNIQGILDETNKHDDTNLPNTNMAKVPLYREKRKAPLFNIGQG